MGTPAGRAALHVPNPARVPNPHAVWFRPQGVLFVLQLLVGIGWCVRWDPAFVAVWLPSGLRTVLVRFVVVVGGTPVTLLTLVVLYLRPSVY